MTNKKRGLTLFSYGGEIGRRVAHFLFIFCDFFIAWLMNFRALASEFRIACDFARFFGFALFGFAFFLCEIVNVVLCESITIVWFCSLICACWHFEIDYEEILVAFSTNARDCDFVGLDAKNLFAILEEKLRHSVEKICSDKFAFCFA